MNQIAKNIVQDDIGKHVVFELNGNIVSVDLSASHIISAMEKYHKLKLEEQPSHISIVMLSRFDEASEKLKTKYYAFPELSYVFEDVFKELREALASQKISGA